uniref:Early endosome antigen 1 n=1 Tax=Myotis myotis TaxID=51298 RepID=A0A7J7Z1W0_MYOMY|nr:early endosome antigen 1 [Myotis myotis]
MGRNLNFLQQGKTLSL